MKCVLTPACKLLASTKAHTQMDQVLPTEDDKIYTFDAMTDIAIYERELDDYEEVPRSKLEDIMKL